MWLVGAALDSVSSVSSPNLPHSVLPLVLASPSLQTFPEHLSQSSPTLAHSPSLGVIAFSFSAFVLAESNLLL